MEKQFLVLIPARFGSTRFPGKPLVKILDKPMIQHVYERASQVFEHVYIATDDERIVNTVEKFGGRVVTTAETHQSGTDRCAEALRKVEVATGKSFDVVINVQGDEPFIATDQLQLITSCFDVGDTDIATLVKRIDKQTDLFDVNKPKVILNKRHQAIYFSRTPIPYMRSKEESQWLHNHVYYKHIGMYAYKSAILKEITLLPQGNLEKAEALEQLRWIENGFTIAVKETDTENMAIDTPADLKYVESVLKERGL
ncbi:MAG: 3-deoxy-manno-octulosonate cytidylyltransferase [Salinivirgaceae bacterium]|jgi:3-deoxy-manno-octulosonate cytidylyltransferase (CMP-KDO synthetase)|nr:3-deoxy-manno-octulosonate cytidylyltransferase [Salinivirgaceae bacterium]